MRGLVQKPLLSVEGTAWSYGDAVLMGFLVGEWVLFERRVALGLALERSGAGPATAGLREAIVAFRRSRRLLAAEDLRGWIADRSLSAGELEQCIGRSVLRSTCSARTGRELLRRSPPSPGEIAGVLRAEAFVDGAFERCGSALAQRAAAAMTDPAPAGAVNPELRDLLVRAASSGPERGFGSKLEERAAEVLRLEASYQRFLERAADSERLRRRLRDRRLDMTRVRFDEIRLQSRTAAREAVLCLTVDGMALPQVAARASVGCTPCEAELASLPGPVRAAMAAARPGELVGPVPDADDAWQLAVLHERQAPVMEEPAVRRRLVDEVAGRALARQAAGRVTWHGHV